MQHIRNAVRRKFGKPTAVQNESNIYETNLTQIEKSRQFVNSLKHVTPICDLTCISPINLEYRYNFEGPFKRDLTFLYLCQTDTAKRVEHIRSNIIETKNRKLKILTFKDQVEGCIFFPKSTWTTGRNKLIEWAKTQPVYDYYILLDDDIEFVKGSYDRVEYEISQLNPFYYCPNLTDYYDNYDLICKSSGEMKYKDINYFKSIWTDAIMCCFNKKIFFDDFILPYEDRYDSVTWWISQAILFYKLNAKYINCSTVSKTCIVNNELHREYPRTCDIFTSLNNYFGHVPVLISETIPLKNDKCVIITTINPPNKQMRFYASLVGYDLIVVADKKTDVTSYEGLKCIMLDLPFQEKISPELYSKIPFNSYTRKMFGYIYAMYNQYDIIYETDDDNMFKTERLTESFLNDQYLVTNTGFANIYNFYTDKLIWPRGIPPGHKSIVEVLDTEKIHTSISIYQGLVDKDPDVDAVYRLKYKEDTFFEKNLTKNTVLRKFTVCPFNSQNTFWVDKTMFYAMYLPVTVTFRYTDILRSFVALFELWKNNKNIAFTPPTAVQERNQHDLEKDRLSEVPMYETAEHVCEILKNTTDKDIVVAYNELLINNIVKSEEIECLKIWLDTVDKSSIQS